MEDRYTTIGIRASTRDKIVKCAEPREGWDTTLTRISNFWLSRQAIINDTEAIAAILKPFIGKADRVLLDAIKPIVDHLKHVQFLVLSVPEPEATAPAPKFSEIMEALRLRRAVEGEENE